MLFSPWNYCLIAFAACVSLMVEVAREKIAVQRLSAISQNWALLLAAVQVINASSGRINNYASEAIHQDKLTLTRTLSVWYLWWKTICLNKHEPGAKNLIILTQRILINSIGECGIKTKSLCSYMCTLLFLTLTQARMHVRMICAAANSDLDFTPFNRAI